MSSLSTGTLSPDVLPPHPRRNLDAQELRTLVRELAAEPTLWQERLAPESAEPGQRHYVSLYRDEYIDVWLLLWNVHDDTGWHDHDVSSGAVAVVDGVVRESWPRIGGEGIGRDLADGSDICFGPEYIHRMGGGVDGSVSIHAYSPPLWRMGQYSISDDGVMRRWSVSYADELRPLDDEPAVS